MSVSVVFFSMADEMKEEGRLLRGGRKKRKKRFAFLSFGKSEREREREKRRLGPTTGLSSAKATNQPAS